MPNERKQKWLGAGISILLHWGLYSILINNIGSLQTAVIIILITIGLAGTYKIKNNFIIGARWASFLTMGFASYARHEYWLEPVQRSFLRLRDFDHPMSSMELLCRGTAEARVGILITSALVIVFYLFVLRWPEWTGRWEIIKQAPLTASLGLQTIIVVTVIYPTPLTMTSALFFAAIISPIVRRQVRLNHIVFLMLVPMFSVGSPLVALIWTPISAIVFIYFVIVEKGMTKGTATFSVFNGIAFFWLFISLNASNWLALFPGDLGVWFSMAMFFFSIITAFVFVLTGDKFLISLRELHSHAMPRFIREAKFWDVRTHWVDREVYCRDNKLYKIKEIRENGHLTIGLLAFGHQHWPAKSEDFTPAEFKKVNTTTFGILIAFYSLWLFVNAITLIVPLHLFVPSLLIGFLFILAVPLMQFAVLFKVKPISYFNLATAFFCALLFVLFMGNVFLRGFNTATSDATKEPVIEQTTNDVSPFDCPCHSKSIVKTKTCVDTELISIPGLKI